MIAQTVQRRFELFCEQAAFIDKEVCWFKFGIAACDPIKISSIMQ
jgi:hypothetical protein